MRSEDAPLWSHEQARLHGGHLARDATAAIKRAGFRIEVCERFSYSPAPLLPADPHIIGVARRL
jgi:hypothetical protein